MPNILTGTSRIPATIDYLVGIFTASTSLGAATPPVAIYDGPTVTRAPDQLILWVGLEDPDSAGLAAMAEGTQEWVGPGSRARNEMFSISCCAVAWSGGMDVRTARLTAAAILAAVEDLLRRDANLGGNVLFVAPGVTSTRWSQNNSSDGAVCQVMFEIACKARIGGP